LPHVLMIETAIEPIPWEPDASHSLFAVPSIYGKSNEQ